MLGSFYPDWVAVRDKAYSWARSQAYTKEINTHRRKRYVTDTAYRETVKRRANNYAENHREGRKAYNKDYQVDNKEAVATRRKAFYAKYMRARRQKNKQVLVDMLGGCCSQCGFDECISALDFHHVDPSTKKLNIAVALIGELAPLVVEIQKCQLLCANCHRMLHWKRDN